LLLIRPSDGGKLLRPGHRKRISHKNFAPWKTARRLRSRVPRHRCACHRRLRSGSDAIRADAQESLAASGFLSFSKLRMRCRGKRARTPARRAVPMPSRLPDALRKRCGVHTSLSGVAFF